MAWNHNCIVLHVLSYGCPTISCWYRLMTPFLICQHELESSICVFIRCTLALLLLIIETICRCTHTHILRLHHLVSLMLSYFLYSLTFDYIFELFMFCNPPLILQTLDILQALCSHEGYQFCRLDGSTPTAKRQSIVEHFNSSYAKESKLTKCSLT